MATYRQRAVTLVTALKNADPSPAFLNKCGRALALRDNIVDQYNGMTDDQKAEYLVKQVRRWLQPYLRELETQVLTQQATSQAVAAADAEFAEAP
jgi:hypothetical protein